jgi:glutathione-specific gamma-glutamylcyclotransferase
MAASKAVAIQTRQGIPSRRLPTPLSASELDASLERALRAWDSRSDLWLFAYGSLIWNPGIPFEETTKATIHGYHRRLCLWSRINRGTFDKPGLVLGLDRGGSCKGLALRLAAGRARQSLAALWKREMVFGSYLPTWINAQTEHAGLRALTFVIDPQSAGFAPRLSDAEITRAVRQGQGRYGACTDYVMRTASVLLEHGIVDRQLLKISRLIDDENTLI